MARKTINYTVQDSGRDQGKVFVLTEMPASKAESWAMRSILALMNGGGIFPEDFESSGMAGLVEIGINALSTLDWKVAEPLLEEMWSCVRIMPDAAKPHIVRPLIEEDIQEVKTRMKLRMEIWSLHTDFLKSDAP